MGATYRRRGKRSWLVTVHFQGQREFKTVHSEQDAKALVQHVHKQELAGVNVVETIQQARTAKLEPAATVAWPRLRDALPAFIDQMAAQGEWTGSTPITYRRRLQSYVYDFALADGRRLGDLTVDQITEPMIGAVLDQVRTAGADGTRPRSLAVQEQIRSPLRRFYRHLIRKQGFPGVNPAADLKDYMGKYPSRRARQGRFTVFGQEEGPALFGTCAAGFPRWLPFIGCCTLAGLRWGEATALEWEDVDWKRSVLHVRRTVCDKTGAVKVCKDREDRYVPMSRQLAAWLREHQANVALEGQVRQWTPDQRALVFPNRRGKLGRYSTFLEHAWQPLLLKAGLRYRKPHSMRHTFATWALEGSEEKGIPPAPILAVRDWMGHASVEETEGYLHRDRARHARAVNHLDAYVSV
jgi:integrase